MAMSDPCRENVTKMSLHCSKTWRMSYRVSRKSSLQGDYHGRITLKYP